MTEQIRVLDNVTKKIGYVDKGDWYSDKQEMEFRLNKQHFRSETTQKFRIAKRSDLDTDWEYKSQVHNKVRDRK